MVTDDGSLMAEAARLKAALAAADAAILGGVEDEDEDAFEARPLGTGTGNEALSAALAAADAAILADEVEDVLGGMSQGKWWDDGGGGGPRPLGSGTGAEPLQKFEAALLAAADEMAMDFDAEEGKYNANESSSFNSSNLTRTPDSRRATGSAV